MKEATIKSQIYSLPLATLASLIPCILANWCIVPVESAAMLHLCKALVTVKG